MAQDATGAPTSLGIPRYNPDGDPPSGNGFNAAMDAIDSLLTSQFVRSVDAKATNEVPVWDGTAFVYQKIGTANIDDGAVTRVKLAADAIPGYGTTLPASPVDGQEYTLVDSITAPTYQWRFRYNAGSFSVHKWEFVGGTHVHTAINTSESANPNVTWIDLATVGPDFTVPRAGDYTVFVSCKASLGAGADNISVGIAVGAGSTPAADRQLIQTQQGSWHISLAGHMVIQGLAANNLLRLRYHSGNQTNTWSNRKFTVIPVRVS